MYISMNLWLFILSICIIIDVVEMVPSWLLGSPMRLLRPFNTNAPVL